MNFNSFFTRLFAALWLAGLSWAWAQTPPKLCGTVWLQADDGHEKLPGAELLLPDTQQGSLTDSLGAFCLPMPGFPATLVVRWAQVADTLRVNTAPQQPFDLFLSLPTTGTVEVRDAADNRLDLLSAQQSELIGEGELEDAACCNLSESFSTTGSVDAVYANAVTGAAEIKLLGLNGIYTQLLQGNLPTLRGMGRMLGLDYVPGAWVSELSLNLGAGSVINGYEGLAGQINIRYHQPHDGPQTLINAYANHNGRYELNALQRARLGPRWSTNLLAHGSTQALSMDNNADGFQDSPWRHTWALGNQWKFRGKKPGRESELGVFGAWEDRWGGQLGNNPFDATETPPGTYAVDLRTRRLEAFAKNGFPMGQHGGLGVQTSVSFHRQDGRFGERKLEGQQATAYANLLYRGEFSGEHSFVTGVSLVADDVMERLDSLKLQRTEVVPGAFFEYAGHFGQRLTLVAGLRADQHNQFGNWLSPRLHVLYRPTEATSLRLGGGRGYRVPTLIADNTGPLVSNRRVELRDPLSPDVGWNAGLSATHLQSLGTWTLTLVADYYFSYFEQQMLADVDESPRLLVLAQQPKPSWAHSAHGELRVRPNRWLNVKLAYRYTRYQQYLGGQYRQRPLTAEHVLLATQEVDRQRWGLSLSQTWRGPQRLPNTAENPEAFRRPGLSPGFWMLNAQATWKWTRLEVYAGAENLTNFRVWDALVAASDPSSPFFDASLAWGPLAGSTWYVGLRFRIDGE